MLRKNLVRKNYIQVLFVFLAFMLMVAIGGFSVSNTLQKASLTAVTVALGETEKTIHAYLREPKIAFDNVYAAVQGLLDRGESQEGLRQYLMTTTELLQNQDDGVKGVISVYGFIRDELVVGSDWIPGADYVPQQRPWYQQAIRSKSAEYTAPYKDEETGLPIISLAQELFGKNGDYYGVLALDIDISWLMDYAESLQFVEGGYGMITNQYLYIVAYPDEQYGGSRLQDLGGGFAKIAEMLRTNRPVSAEPIRDVNGKRAIVFFQQLSNSWYVGVVMPSRSYYADLYLNLAILATLGAVLASILSYILLHLSAEKHRSEEESKAKSSFLATMSHEIRTPMNAIIGIAQIEMQKGNLPEDYSQALDKIYTSGSSLLGIINDILDLSKIETGRLELTPKEYDMPSLINDTVQLNIVRIGSKPIKFVLSLEETLPLTLYGDELRIKQILNNLLSNAIKFTDEGRVELSISHTRQSDEVTLSFSVTDTGIGMKPEEMEQLFSEYMRFNADVNRNTEGTGLGLSITRRLVKMMGGTIEAESEYGKGSVFTVTLKQKPAGCEAIGKEIADRLCSFSFIDDSSAEKMKFAREPMPYGSVLVVDDVDMNLYVAEGVLQPYELQIELVESGFAAIERVENGKIYDVIFMDHMMPKMDGIETTQRLRANGYKGAIVALTANALVGNEEMFVQNGFDGFLPKPIDIQLMDAILNKFIRGRHKG